MIECGSCDQPAVLADPDTDHRNVFARVENGRIVFIIHGRGAVSRVFPKAPKAVTFWTMVRHEPASKHTVPNIEESQSVVVNCRSSDSTGASRRRCDAPANAASTAPPIDPTAPRRVHVVALSYDGAWLMRNLDVQIRSEDLRTGQIVRSTGPTGRFSILQAARDSVAFEALCPSDRGDRTKVSGKLALYLAAGRDTTLQLLVDQRRCSSAAANSN
jgi:hypothetical protein